LKNSAKQQIHRQRRAPERSCVACRGKMAKRELIRLVGNADVVQIDPKGKEAGRGAYLCPIRECWETGLKGNRLEHALRVKLTLENRQVLVEYGKSLPERESRS
jgi:predicted RNA-binding protein YlxR (DUF448 family)